MTALDSELARSPTEEPDSSEETDVAPAVSVPTARPGGRVRFRSRVRIGSGLSRQRTDSFRYSGEYVGTDSQLFVGAASLSSSPSSSISAPLRSEPTNDDERRPEWGPLGQRVRLFACRSKARSAMTPAQEMEKRDRRRRKLGLPPLDPSSYPGDSRFASPNENTPLLGSPYQRRSMASWYAEHEGVQPGDTYDSDDEREAESEASRLSREVDRTFGPLPGRLLSRRWWWWQIEPFVTCNCTIHEDNEY
ncbi:hypothetical protein PTI98_001859 [Pleurotus ostreatus]|nr:hypothetical protein PTI98_001859 [Pleurotus ostreatus]